MAPAECDVPGARVQRTANGAASGCCDVAAQESVRDAILAVSAEADELAAQEWPSGRDAPGVPVSFLLSCW